VLGQTWTDLELVISDNASDDDTQALCEQFSASDTRVRYERQEANIGAERNFRAALEHARGELFMWLADDDWLDREYVEACTRVLVERPDHALVCGQSRYFRDDVFAFAERPVNLQQASPGSRVLAFYRTVTLNGPFYGLMRREHLLHAAPLRNCVGADWLLVASVAYRGKVRTLDGVAINRSLEGASKDHAGLAGAYDLSPRQSRNWHLLIARAAYRDITSASWFRELGRGQRLRLAVGAACLVVTRFSGKVWLGRVLGKLGLFERARAWLEHRRRSSA